MHDCWSQFQNKADFVRTKEKDTQVFAATSQLPHFASTAKKSLCKRSDVRKLWRCSKNSPLCHLLCVNTLQDRKDFTNTLLWSKTTQTTGGVGGAGVDPPTWKMTSIFLVSFAFCMPIYRHFQSNISFLNLFLWLIAIVRWPLKSATVPYSL